MINRRYDQSFLQERLRIAFLPPTRHDKTKQNKTLLIIKYYYHKHRDWLKVESSASKYIGWSSSRQWFHYNRQQEDNGVRNNGVLYLKEIQERIISLQERKA